jgi:hypothetical protein
MSLKVSVNFAVQLVGDGVATSLDVDLQSDPLFFSQPSGLNGYELSPLFDNRQPTAVILISAPAGTVIATISKSIISFTFSVAPPDGISVLRGIIEF